MFDFLFQNLLELKILSGFLLIALICFFIIWHEYIHQKVLGWIYIILFMFLIFISNITLIFALIILWVLTIAEFYKVLDLKKIKDIFYFLWFLIVLWGFLFFIYEYTKIFFYLFILVSLSDIIAYFIGKYIPYKKGFTPLSPNKSLSWVIAQILFIVIILMILGFTKLIPLNIIDIILYLLIWFWAPIWDLSESYFKRRAGIKDMGEYIPWHGWVLDRIDSILLSGSIIWVGFLFWLL